MVCGCTPRVDGLGAISELLTRISTSMSLKVTMDTCIPMMGAHDWPDLVMGTSLIVNYETLMSTNIVGRTFPPFTDQLPKINVH